MPYDPYAQPNPWWRQQQGPQQAPQQGAQFAQPPAPQRPKQWYEGMPTAKPGQFANRPANSPDDANSAKQPQPSLMQMLMLGGPGPIAARHSPARSKGLPARGRGSAACSAARGKTMAALDPSMLGSLGNDSRQVRFCCRCWDGKIPTPVVVVVVVVVVPALAPAALRWRRRWRRRCPHRWQRSIRRSLCVRKGHVWLF